jgi:tetratricopeptide (TPR) repeat protein
MIFNRGFVAGVAMTLSACATHARPVSSILIRRGEPTVSYGTPAKDDKSNGERKAAVDPSIDRSPRLLPDSGTTVEGTDKPLSEALKTLKTADTASNHLAVANEYRRLRILDKAFDQATLALKLDHRSADALEQRAQIWREWGLPQRGLPDAQRAVYFAPGSASAQNTLGTLLQSVGQPEAARGRYMHVIELDPAAAYAWSNLCYLSLLTANADRAITECETALRQNPDLQSARNNIALSYAVAGRVEDAREELLAGGSPADAAFNLGMLYLSLGSYQLAEESFRAATDLRPNFSAAQTRRRQAALLAAAKMN